MVLPFGVRKLEGLEEIVFRNYLGEAKIIVEDNVVYEKHPKSQRYVLVVNNGFLLGYGTNSAPKGYSYFGKDVGCVKNFFNEMDIHAEEKALDMALDFFGSSFVKGSTVFHVAYKNGFLTASGEPSCINCSKRMVNLGVGEVVLYNNDSVWGESGLYAYESRVFHNLTGDSMKINVRKFMD